jgi:hypothetical protein
MLRVLAGCVACGWRGVVVSGWVPVERAPEHRRQALAENPRRRRWRGDRLQVRVRLRDSDCPRCERPGLERAVPAEMARSEVDRVARAVRTI